MTTESDFITALANLLPELEPDENLFAGPVRVVQAEVPPDAVFCLASGGDGPAPYLGNQADFRRPSIQVRVRHETLENGRTLVDAIQTAMHRAPIDGYDFCRARTEPVYLGQDDETGLFEWSLNFELGLSG